jgi:hypothetical protein
MSVHDLRDWQHAHDFGSEAERHAERRTRWVVGLVTHSPWTVGDYRQLLAEVRSLDHVTVEIHHCRDVACRPGESGGRPCLGACRTWESSAVNAPRQSIFCRFLGQ